MKSCQLNAKLIRPCVLKMKSLFNSSMGYLPRSASGSSCSTTSKSSASRSIGRSIKSFSDQTAVFILFKMLCCFFISLANFAFNEKLTGLVASMFADSPFKPSQHLCENYQDYLVVLEIGCWIVPLLVYQVWSKVGSLASQTGLPVIAGLC